MRKFEVCGPTFEMFFHVIFCHRGAIYFYLSILHPATICYSASTDMIGSIFFFWGGVGGRLPLFSSNKVMVIKFKQFNIYFMRLKHIYPQAMIFFPMCNLVFLMALLEQHFIPFGAAFQVKYLDLQ